MLLNRFVLPLLALVTASAMAVPADAREFSPEPSPSTAIERPILRRDRPVRPTERPTLSPIARRKHPPEKPTISPDNLTTM
jgi:hypothetical protein